MDDDGDVGGLTPKHLKRGTAGGGAGGACARVCCSSAVRTRVDVLYKLLMLLLMFIVLGYGVRDHYSGVLSNMHRDVPRTLFLSTAQRNGASLTTAPSTQGTVCFAHLAFDPQRSGSRAAGAVCLNPTTGYVAYDIEVYDAPYAPPLSRLAIHGPTTDAAAKPAPEYLVLDAVGGAPGEGVLWGLLPTAPALLAQIIASPAQYYIEMRPRNATTPGGITGAPLRSGLQ
jgi:hypothetical protein